MDKTLRVADNFRWIARMLTIVLIPSVICYSTIIASPRHLAWGDVLGFRLYLPFLFAILAGLLVAWWNELIGALIALAAFAGLLISALALGWIGEVLEQGALLIPPVYAFVCMLAGPREYYLTRRCPPVFSLSRISWALLLLPILLFAASWWLRREATQRSNESRRLPMNPRIKLADIARWIARALSIPIILIATCFALFGIGEGIGEGANPISVILIVLLFLAMPAGFLIAWRREGLGALVASAGVGAYLVAGWALGWFGEQFLEDASPLAGALHLFFALTVNGYHVDASPLAQQVPWISWALVVLPIFLFAASWWLRRGDKSAAD